MPVITFIIAIIPAVLILYLYYRKDDLRPEPRTMVSRALVFGALSIIPVGAIELGLQTLFSPVGGVAALFVDAFLVAALCEEGAKYLIITRYFRKQEAFDEVTDGIVYAVAVSMGFALLENLLYSVGSPIQIALLRAFTAVPLHAVATGIMGYHIGRAKFDQKRDPKQGLLVAIGIHGLYNFLLFTGSLLGLLVIPLLIASFRRLKRLYAAAQLEDRYYGRS